jgi:hypothetical protein
VGAGGTEKSRAHPRGVKKKFCDTELSGLSVKNAKIEKRKFFFVIFMINLNKFSLLVGHNY